jgi:hypothetical protein
VPHGALGRLGAGHTGGVDEAHQLGELILGGSCRVLHGLSG